jgi:hypothetical protein
MSIGNVANDPDFKEAFRKEQAIATYNRQGGALISEQDHAALEARPQPSAAEQARVTAPVLQVVDR